MVRLSPVLLLCSVFLYSSALTTPMPGGGANLVATPTLMHPGFTKNQEITCSFRKPPGSNIKGVMAIILSKGDKNQGGSYSEVASVNAFAKGDVLITDNLSSDDITGGIDNAGISYISYKWTDYPDSTDILGDYYCQVHVLSGGRPQTFKALMSLKGAKPQLKMVIEKLQEMEVLIENQTAALAELGRSQADSTAALAELGRSQADSTQTFKDFLGFYWTSNLSPSASFQGHQYFLAPKDSIDNVDQALQLCRNIGGHLAEIDDREEWDFVVDFIGKQSSKSSYIYLGSYMDNHGKWRYFRNDQILKYEHDALDGTNGTGDVEEKCAAIYTGPFYADFECNPSTKQQCLCEKE